MDLGGTAAIVTGGAGGLGSATATRLDALGATVVLLDRSERRLAEVVEALGRRPVAVTGTDTDDADVGRAIDAARAAGRFSLVVTAAGGGLGGEPIVGPDREPHDMDSFRSTMERNAIGPFNVCRLAAAAMMENEPDADGQRGVVVNTASVAGYEGQIGQIGYASAKAAVLGMTLPMARELAAYGIRACAIAPGTMSTPPMEHLDPEVHAAFVASIPFPKRMGHPDEFARLVTHIATNPYLNGENIRLDGAVRLPPE